MKKIEVIVGFSGEIYTSIVQCYAPFVEKDDVSFKQKFPVETTIALWWVNMDGIWTLLWKDMQSYTTSDQDILYLTITVCFIWICRNEDRK